MGTHICKVQTLSEYTPSPNCCIEMRYKAVIQIVFCCAFAHNIHFRKIWTVCLGSANFKYNNNNKKKKNHSQRMARFIKSVKIEWAKSFVTLIKCDPLIQRVNQSKLKTNDGTLDTKFTLIKQMCSEFFRINVCVFCFTFAVKTATKKGHAFKEQQNHTTHTHTHHPRRTSTIQFLI